MKKILFWLIKKVFKPKDRFGLPIMDFSVLTKGGIMTDLKQEKYREDFENDARGTPGGLQGDVALIKCQKPTGKLKKRPDNIVAYGEVTGHHHVLDTACEVYENELGELFALVPQVADPGVSHHEHGKIILDPEWYAIDIQQEYDGEKERRVLD